MAIRSEEKDIGEYRFRVTQFPAEVSIPVSMEILGIVGPALAVLAEAEDGDQDGPNPDLARHMAEAFFARAKPDVVLRLLKKVAEVSKVRINDTWHPLSKQFDLVFSGSGMATLVLWAKFAFEVQFKDFFDSLGGQMREALEEKRAAKADEN